MNGNDLVNYIIKGMAFVILCTIAFLGLVALCAILACACYGADRYICTPQGCFIVSDSKDVAAKDAGFSWTKQTEEQYLLRKDGRIVGQYITWNGKYYPFDGVNNLPEEKPPIDPPGRTGAMSEDLKRWCTNGVQPANLSGAEMVTHSGKSLNPKLMQAAFDGNLADDSQKGYLVIIAKDDAKRQAVLSDWGKLPAEFTARYNVWMAPPEHFSMNDRFSGKPRFHVEGDPTVVLQKSDGTVLFRRPQAEQKYKSTDMQDLLKSDPSYKPALDPGGPEASSSFINPSAGTATASLVALFGGALLIFRRKP